MATTYSAAVKNARMDAVLAEIGDAGKVKIYAANGTTLLCTFVLPTPSGTVTTDTLTFDIDPDIDEASADATDTAALATITTSADTVCVSGLTVGTSGTDVIISPSTSITTGQVVTLTALSIQHG